MERARTGGVRAGQSRALTTGMTPMGYQRRTSGASAGTASRGFRMRLGLGGLWAVASTVTVGLSLYLVGFFVVFAVKGSSDEDLSPLLVLGLAALIVGAAGLWLTVPPPAKDLALTLDQVETTLGGAITGRLVNDAPDQPLELAAVARGLHPQRLSPLHFGQSTWVVRARVDPDQPDQRFRIELPADAPPTRRGGMRPCAWWVIARRPRRLRSPVAAVPITVRV